MYLAVINAVFPQCFRRKYKVIDMKNVFILVLISRRDKNMVVVFHARIYLAVANCKYPQCSKRK